MTTKKAREWDIYVDRVDESFIATTALFTSFYKVRVREILTDDAGNEMGKVKSTVTDERIAAMLFEWLWDSIQCGMTDDEILALQLGLIMAVPFDAKNYNYDVSYRILPGNEIFVPTDRGVELLRVAKEYRDCQTTPSTNGPASESRRQ